MTLSECGEGDQLLHSISKAGGNFNDPADSIFRFLHPSTCPALLKMECAWIQQ